jgi:hypothetical protein
MNRSRIANSAQRVGVCMVAWSVGLAACSDSERETPTVPPSALVEVVTPATPSSEEFFVGRTQPPPTGHAEFLAHARPEADGFPAESAALAVEHALELALSRALRAPAELESIARELTDASFQGTTALTTTELEPVRTDAWISIRRAKSISSDVDPAIPFAERLSAWLNPLAGASESRVKVRVERAEAESGGPTSMEIEMRLLAVHAGARVQHNVRWRAHWTSALPPRLVDARLVAFEEVRASAAALTDSGRAAFGASPFYVDELWRGSDELVGRSDRLGGERTVAMHGIAVGDVDGDGIEDVYVPQPAGVPNRLLLHKADGRVEDASAAASVDWLDPCSVALIVDLDGDMHRDLAVCSGSVLIVAWNDGTGRFRTREAFASPDAAWITVLSAADVDRDGDLDLFAGRYAPGGMDASIPVPYYDARHGAANVFWRNDGGRKFKDATAEVGLDANNSRFTQAALLDDLDDDGDPDLYAVNDFGRNNYYRNDAGKFADVTSAVQIEHSAAGMGASSTDVDLDGDMDLFLSNMDSPSGQRIVSSPRFMPQHRELAPEYMHHSGGNTLFLNRGDGTFEDATSTAGVARGGWAWGAVFLDLDNDGLEDVYVPNGFVSGSREDDIESSFWRQVIGHSPADSKLTPEYREAWASLRHMMFVDGFSWNGHERNFVYLNLGGARFADISAASGADSIGDARGCAVLDWNDDGRMDLLLRNRTRPRLSLFVNTHPAPGRFLSVELVGPPKNFDAIGAHVFVDAGSKKLRQSVVAAEGYLTAPSRRLVFGVGDVTSVERVRVRWPDGTKQEFGPLETNARYRFVQGEPAPVRVERRVREEAREPANATGEALAGRVSRIVLSDRLPMRAIELDRFDGSPVAISDLAGRGIVLCLWVPGHAASEGMIDALSTRARELESKGIDLATIVRSDANGIESARARLKAAGIDARSGPASKRVLLALEIALIEVLGPYDRLPMPLVFLLDRGGNLVAIHCGEADVARIVDDASRIVEMNPSARSTEKLLGGRWLYQPQRDLPAVAEVFDRLGMATVAAFYRDMAAKRE